METCASSVTPVCPVIDSGNSRPRRPQSELFARHFLAVTVPAGQSALGKWVLCPQRQAGSVRSSQAAAKKAGPMKVSGNLPRDAICGTLSGGATAGGIRRGRALGSQPPPIRIMNRASPQ